jgi:uncharacterized membrane protein
MSADSKSPGILPIIARIALVAGAAGSVALTLKAGHAGIILTVLFVGWVALPFAGLGLVDLLSSEWSRPARTTLYLFIVIVAAVSPAIYGYVVTHPRPQQAFPFLVTPFVTWVLLVIVAIASRWLSRSTTEK